ncbi:MAG TPA: UbiA family prenyltransferase [Candidatus Obscuribacterales bacterium]
MESTQTSASWFRRWGIYLHEMFQPGSRLVFSALTTLGLGWAVQVLQGQGVNMAWVGSGPPVHYDYLTLGARFVLGTVSVFLVLLYYRLCDEFKDIDTDREHFPERPVPSGRVELRDLLQMKIVATLLAFGLNLLFPLALLPFMALWIFAWLMGKWFFLPDIIGRNRLLAFITHSPISLLGSFYVIALFRQPGEGVLNLPLLSLPYFLLALWFALPGMAWEVARKTRAPEHEAAGYQIYSSMLGYRGAAALPPFFTLAELGIGLWLARTLGLPFWWNPALALVSLAYILPFVLFLRQPLQREAWLKPASEAYTVLLLIGLPMALVQGRSVILWPAGGF